MATPRVSPPSVRFSRDTNRQHRVERWRSASERRLTGSLTVSRCHTEARASSTRRSGTATASARSGITSGPQNTCLVGTDRPYRLMCYKEVFEHSPCLGRNEIWTPAEWRSRLLHERPVDWQQDGCDVFYWRHFRLDGKQWRWSESFGWDAAGLNPLEPLVR